MLAAVDAGAEVLKRYKGRLRDVRTKHDHVNVVTEADVGSERAIMEVIASAFPGHSRLGEETGYVKGREALTWIVDPLDGTSNYAAGIPWYGVLVAVLDEHGPLEGCMDLVDAGDRYLAARGQGATRNGRPIHVSEAKDLEEVLFVHMTESAGDQKRIELECSLMARTIGRIRNLRGTNCLVDLAYVADGRFGGCVNHHTSLWDIAAPHLIIQEAGGIFTTITGEEISYGNLEGDPDMEIQVLAAPEVLHRQMLALLNTTR